jgi:uncharacterized membrane protein
VIEAFVRDWALQAASLIDGAATLVIVLASLQAIWGSVAALAGPRRELAVLQSVRVRLSRWLALALELLIGSDIVRTAVAPSWTEIGQLGAIVVLRVVINYTLMHDIRESGANES